MRRLKILYYWLFFTKNNIGFRELLRFLLKPKVHTIAKKYAKEIVKKDLYYEVSLYNTPHTLFWPVQFPVQGISQVVCETFDEADWHYYQKKYTVIENDEMLLDIGTAEGLLPLTVVDKCKKIILVEPNKHFCDALQRTFAPFR